LLTRAVFYADQLEDAEKARKYRLKLAALFRKNSDFEREVRSLRDILARTPEDLQVLGLLEACEFARDDKAAGAAVARRLAGLQIAVGKRDAGRKTLLNAAERAPGSIELIQALFDLHRELSQPNQAISWGKKLINLDTDAGKLAEASDVYDQLVEIDPENIDLKLDQIRFLENSGRTADLTEKRLALANQYQKFEKLDRAEALLQDAVAADPRSVPARERLAALYYHIGANEKAENQFITLAGHFHMEGNTDQALSILHNVKASNPVNTEAIRQIVQVHKTAGNTAEAVKELHGLADLLQKQGLESESLEVEREAIELAPRDISSRHRHVNSLVRVNKAGQAAEELEKIARMQIERQQPDQAMVTLNEALDQDANRLSVRKVRAELLMQMGKTDDAMEELKTIAEIATSHAQGQSPESASQIGEGLCTLELVKEYDFENFVVGASNDFACATALAIARSPARAYNPLFLYADVGLGKTHLCNAIANYLLERNPRTRIIYTNSEDFTGELIHAIQNNEVQQFRSRYRNLDLLIVDDVQFLAGKERTQEEFFHIFNSLFQAKRQIVITSDRPPSEIAHLESRLRSRFGAGVIVDIASPDFETRLAILQREIAQSEITIAPSIAAMIAEHIDTNVRDLKGALNQITAMRNLRNQKVTEESVSQMLNTLYPATAARQEG
jgi:chromosomal replication initiator protein DnaA